jgi:UDP-N-acetyl-D-mannosaminuronate dehydrogenase
VIGHLELLLQRIEARKAVVGVVGMVYVGLPVAATFALAGFKERLQDTLRC